MNNILQHIIDYLKDPDTAVIGIFIFLISYVISRRMIPLIIETVHYKKLMDHPNERSSHSEVTPTLAGVAFFGSLIIGIFLIHYFYEKDISFNIIAALTVLFFLGLKDDLMVLSSKTKVFSQTVAIVFILFCPELQITSFHGFFGLTEVPLWLVIPLSYFIVLYIINAYNLIDGIDGLAGILGIVFTFIFAVFFFMAGEYFYALLSIIIVGFLLAFLRYNLSKKKKIFMGDTGSMIVGFMLGLLTLKLLALSTEQFAMIRIKPQNIFIVTLSILFFPMIDVIRVIIVRLVNGTGAFSADRRHMHHVFIDKGLPHIQATFTFAMSNILAFIIIYLSNEYLSYIGLSVLFVVITIITFYLLLLLDVDPSARVQRKKIKPYIPKRVYETEFKIRKSFIIFLKKLFYKNML